MKFSEIKFKRDGDYPWSEGKMARIAFKDCENRLTLDEDGYFYAAEDDEVDRPQKVIVTAYHEVAGKLVDHHRTAFEHFIENASAYETRLLKYLGDIAAENIKSALAVKSWRQELMLFLIGKGGLKSFIKKHSLDAPDGIKKQIVWTGLGLYDQGIDGVGLITVDFHCGWDDEHGISVLMHKGKVLCHGGLADYSNRGDSLLETAKCDQSHCKGYDLKL